MGFKKTTAGLLIGAFMLPSIAQTTPALAAATPPTPQISANDMKYASRLYLAYVRTGKSQTDEVSRKGVEALSEALNGRTSVEPAGVVGLDIERDNLAFFPFIYWPVQADSPALSAKAQMKVQQYLNAGGFIVFDMDSSSVSVDSQKTLKRVLGNVGLKPLTNIEKDHALTKTFFLVSRLRGTYDYSSLMVETTKNDGTESISSVIIGENDWAGAWAGQNLPPDSREREMAIRAGINMVFYALTGNYKIDQARILNTMDKLEKK